VHNPKSLLQRLLALGPTPEALRARSWYEDFADRLKTSFGQDQWVWIAAAWGLTQEAGLEAIAGSRLVRRVASASPQDPTFLEGPDLLHDISFLVHNRKPLKPLTAYVLDLTDVLLDRPMRTCMGDDPRGGRPVPLDVWSFRSAGYVDTWLRDWLLQSFPDSNLADLKVDVFGEEQYEHCSRWYNDLSDSLRSERFLGVSTWHPHHAEALGRFTFQRSVGHSFAWPEELF